MEQELDLEQVKAQLSVTKIQRDGGPVVPLATWQGWSATTPVPHMNGLVRYFLDGNRLRVRQDASGEEGWYTLS
jgi:hypothetical protein